MNESKRAELLRRIDNWIWWGRSHSEPQGRCGSIESRYVAPRPDDGKAEAKALIRVDAIDAERVDIALRSMKNADQRIVIVRKYQRRAPVKAICDELRIARHSFDTFLAMALDELAYSIRYVESRERVAKQKAHRYKSNLMTKRTAETLPAGRFGDREGIQNPAS